MITTDRDLRKMRKRITWTSFHLPSTQPWPTWAGQAIAGGNETTDPYRGVLHKVPGLENVRLARRAEDVEQAAYILRQFYRPIISIELITHARPCIDLKSSIVYICGQCRLILLVTCLSPKLTSWCAPTDCIEI
jgi:hypothetical protein